MPCLAVPAGLFSWGSFHEHLADEWIDFSEPAGRLARGGHPLRVETAQAASKSQETVVL